MTVKEFIYLHFGDNLWKAEKACAGHDNEKLNEAYDYFDKLKRSITVYYGDEREPYRAETICLAGLNEMVKYEGHNEVVRDVIDDYGNIILWTGRKHRELPKTFKKFKK